MSIPVHLQQFRSAGVYKIVWDKSTILNQDTTITRLVVGFSEQGPFNVPTYVSSVSDFKAIYGDVSKKLEKRGIYFHRMALQCLQAGPILCLNLKKFDGEVVNAANIDTDFNALDPIDTVEVKVEDIYDTTRFWTLSADKLGIISDTNGKALNGYIRIAATNTSNTSNTYFIRKASGSKVTGYNVTVSDWYKDSGEDVPEYLQKNLNCKMSDFIAEIYVFKGKFEKDQVISSPTLSTYFDVVNDELQLKPMLKNVYGEPTDTLDALYQDATSGAIGHYIGSLIPLFKDKIGAYQSLDIKFNDDVERHNLMMYFDTDALEEGMANIDLSGHSKISTKDSDSDDVLNLENIYNETAKTTVLGNSFAPIVSEIISFNAEYNNVKASGFDGKNITAKRVDGNMYVDSIVDIKTYDNNAFIFNNANAIIKKALGYVYPDFKYNGTTEVSINNVHAYVPDSKWNGGKGLLDNAARCLGAIYRSGAYTGELEFNGEKYAWNANKELKGSNWCKVSESGVTDTTLVSEIVKSFAVNPNAPIVIKIDAYDIKFTGENVRDGGYSMNIASVGIDGDILVEFNSSEELHNKMIQFGINQYNAADGSVKYYGGAFKPVGDHPEMYINSISGYDFKGSPIAPSIKFTNKVNFVTSPVVYAGITGDIDESLYGASISFITVGNDWDLTDNLMTCSLENSLSTQLAVGDCFLAEDGSMEETKDDYFDNVYVQEVGYKDEEGARIYYVKFTGAPKMFSKSGVNYLVRVGSALNQEIGVMKPQYMHGYEYKNSKPASTSMLDKLNWQNFILSVLTDYKGIRTALLEKSEVDYRYIVDTFESYVGPGCKNVLTFLAKEKQSAFAILNFPSVQTFVKCPYASFTDSKGIFNTKYVVKGYNPSKSHSLGFSIPSDAEGASFGAFYTPLKFSDGYINSNIPSAGLVSNLFVEKYMSRQPYYIIAGPNYGAMSASGLVGPDYNFCRAELDDLEPFGVNCMVYRPGFGTFINSNQTAKQTPVSALSKVHIRELVIYLQDEIEKILQQFQWEFNNQVVRNKIKDKADAICLQVQKNGGLIDFINIMDESNNTPEIIDNEMAVLSTHIEPGRGMGKMVHELTLYRTGMMRASISE